MEPIPNTSDYMIAGYAIAFLVMSLYVFSIYLRYHSLSRDLETLEIVSNESKPKSARAEKSKPAAKKSKASIKKKK